MFRRSITALVIIVFAGCFVNDEQRPFVVSTSDVHRFAAVMRRPVFDGDCSFLRSYFDSASAGLRAYDRKFHEGREQLCRALKTNGARYDGVAGMLPALDTAARQVTRVFTRFQALDPTARMPDTYFVVGDEISAGTTITGRRPMILVGVELLHSVNGLTWTLAHELAHTQQHYPLWGSLTGGPPFLRATVLRQAITEGSADLVAEVLTGLPKRNAYGEAHEAEVWRDFQRDMHSRDFRKWLYNGRSQSAGSDRPSDLGYWVGYRIVQSFYARSPDKVDALRDILTIRDFDAFLTRSGYDGGSVRPPMLMRW